MADPLSPKSPRKGKIINVRVHFLDDSVHAFQIPTKASGAVLWDQIIRHLQLMESDYFDVEYSDEHGVLGWVDRDKPVIKQLPSPDTPLRFRVKFYMPDPSLLEEEFTRYLFSLQIKHDLSLGLMTCSENTSALLASYIAQAEIGDFSMEDFVDHTYLSNLKFFPNQTESLEIKIMEYHRNHLGLSPSDADLNLLDTARKVELYGILMYQARDHECVQLTLAVAHMGLLVFQNHTKINTFSWAKIRKLSFKRKKFLIKLHPESYGYYRDTVEFFFESRNECKGFWKRCIEHHAFFRCLTVKKLARNKTRVVSRGSSFRYSGRTQKQLLEFVRENYTKHPGFERSVSGRISCRSTSVTPKINPKSSTLNSSDLRIHNSTASSGSHILDTSQDNHLCSTRVETAEVHSDSSMSGSRSLGSPKLETARSHDGLVRDGTEPEGSGEDLDVPDHERGAQNELDTYNSHDNVFMSSANQNANDNDDNLSQASYNLHDEDDEGLHDKSAASDDLATQVLKSVRFIDEKPSPNSIHNSSDDIAMSNSPIEGDIDTEASEQPVADVCGQSSLSNLNASSPISTGNESMSDIDMVCETNPVDNGRLSDEVVSTPEDIDNMDANTNDMDVSNNETDNTEVVDKVVPDNANLLNRPLVEDRPIKTEISGLSDVDNNNQQASELFTPDSVIDAPLLDATCNGNVNNVVDNLVLPDRTSGRPVNFDDNSNLLENIPYILHRRRLQSDNDIKSETELYIAVATALQGGGLCREKSPTSPGYVLGREKSPSRMPNAHIEQLKFKADSPQLPGKRSPGAWSPGGWSPGSWSPLDRSPASKRRLELVNYHKLPAKDSFSCQDDTSNAHQRLIDAQVGREKHRLDVSTINQINETKKQTTKFTLSMPPPPPERTPPILTADKKKQGREYSKLTAEQRFLPITKGFNIICLQSSSHSSQESSPVQQRHAIGKAEPQDETATPEISTTSQKNNQGASLEISRSKEDNLDQVNTVNDADDAQLPPLVETPVPDSDTDDEQLPPPVETLVLDMISSIDELPPPPDDTDYNAMSCYPDLPDDSFLPPPPEEFVQDDEILPPPPQDFDVPETFHVRDASMTRADVLPVELATAEKILHFDKSDDYPQLYERSTITFSTFKPDDSPMRIDDNQPDILVTDASLDNVCPKPRPLSTDSDRLGTIHEEIIVGGNAVGGMEVKRHSIQSETDTPRRLSLLDDDSSLGDSQYYEESMDANDMLEPLEGLDNRDTSSVTSSSLESEESSESSSDEEGGNAGIVQQLMARANGGEGNRNLPRGKHEPSPVDPLEKLESLIEEEGEDTDGSSSMMGEGIDSSSSEESDIEDTPRQKRISIDPLEHLDHLDIIKVDYFSGESDTEGGPQRIQGDTQTTTVPKLVVSRGSDDGRFITRDRNDAVSTEQSKDLQGGLALNLDRVVNNRSSGEGLSPGSRSQDSSSDTTEPTDSSPAMSSPDSSHYLPYRSANNNQQGSNPADEVYQNPYADSGVPVHLQKM